MTKRVDVLYWVDLQVDAVSTPVWYSLRRCATIIVHCFGTQFVLHDVTELQEEGVVEIVPETDPTAIEIVIRNGPRKGS